MEPTLIDLFALFSLAGLIGFLIGLEREMSGGDVSMGGRDFVLFALTGAASAYAGMQLAVPLALPIAFGAVVVLVVSRYWKDDGQGPGITTELAAVLTFLLGALVIQGAREIAIALAILMLALLAHKRAIKSFRHRIKARDLQGALKFLVITFIVLPVLPRESLDTYLWLDVGEVAQVDRSTGEVEIHLHEGRTLEPGDRARMDLGAATPAGDIEILRASNGVVIASVPEDKPDSLAPGAEVQAPLGIELVSVMLSAIKPYSIWLIVILVSLISLVGYVLIQLLGSGVGVGLTGLLGGLVSSTVTTLSFARRSLERRELEHSFSIAILLASSMMFPRLLLEMLVVNRALAANVALPLLLMSLTGFGLAALRFVRARRSLEDGGPVELDNPFSLTAAVSFGLVFAAILILTRTATHYLGDAWLPAVAIISGLTDADAIAFSVSDAQRADWISLRWASFNLVLGAISNTMMKLVLVLLLADRGLFWSLLPPFAAIGIVGFGSTLLYYGFLPGMG